MRNYPTGLKLSLYTFLVLSLLTLAAYHSRQEILRAAYKLLIVSDPLKKADAIVVLGGDYKRLEKAVEIFREGYAKELILTGYLITTDVSTADLWMKRAQKLGVSGEVIHPVRISTSTYTDAVLSAEVMKQNGLTTAIIVTSPEHSRRARWVFRKIFGQNGLEVAATCIYTEEAGAWENKDAENRDPLYEHVILEYLKFPFYYLCH